MTLKPGSHRIEISARGFSPARFEVRVESGGPGEIAVDMKKE
jgi:hypothetical protein